MKSTIVLLLMAGVAQVTTPAKPTEPTGPKAAEVKPQEKPSEKAVVKPDGKAEKKPTGPMYTTYFYTAAEAIVHGYEPDTKVRIVNLAQKGTIWEGTVGPGETRTVQTGGGVFGFIADKKATILVGTPTSCTVVGYFLKDEKGAFKSNRFYGQLPTGAGAQQHFIIWAYEPSSVGLFKNGAHEPFKKAQLEAGEFLDLTGDELVAISGQTIEVRASNKGVAAQVYYDEGFMVPADNGRGSGKRFLTYVGTLTTGENDLNVIAQGADANVTVTDLKEKKVLFKGQVKKGQIHTMTMRHAYVEVTSDVPVNAVVAAFKHYQAGYAEHHFQTGLEGSGIENDFLVTTSGELWLFSYFTGNEIQVEDARSGAKIFKGVLQAGQATGLQPGFGLFRVKGSKGLSAMGGASSCGADYSPAGSMFAVDEALFAVLTQVKEERARHIEAQTGRRATKEELEAPLTGAEYKKYAPKMEPAAARPMTLDELNERAASMH